MKNVFKFFALSALLMSFALFAGSVFAQSSTTGSIEGTVTDQTGAARPARALRHRQHLRIRGALGGAHRSAHTGEYALEAKNRALARRDSHGAASRASRALLRERRQHARRGRRRSMARVRQGGRAMPAMREEDQADSARRAEHVLVQLSKVGSGF